MSELSQKEQDMRVEALNNAVRHRLANETPSNVVEAAKKYLQFLQGGEDATNE